MIIQLRWYFWGCCRPKMIIGSEQVGMPIRSEKKMSRSVLLGSYKVSVLDADSLNHFHLQKYRCSNLSESLSALSPICTSRPTRLSFFVYIQPELKSEQKDGNPKINILVRKHDICFLPFPTSNYNTLTPKAKIFFHEQGPQVNNKKCE